MTPNACRLARTRDFALICVGAALFVLAAAVVAGWIWFRALFVAAFGGTPLLWAGGFLAGAIVLGVWHAFARPPSG